MNTRTNQKIRFILRLLLDRIPSHFGSVLMYLVLLFLTSSNSATSLGFSNIFRDSKAVQTDLLASLNSPALWTNFFLMFLTCVLLVFPVFESAFDSRLWRQGKNEVQDLGRKRFFVLLVCFAYGVLFFRWTQMDDSNFLEPYFLCVSVEIWRAMVGAMLGFLAFLLGVLAMSVTEVFRRKYMGKVASWVQYREAGGGWATAFMDRKQNYSLSDRMERYARMAAKLSIVVPLLIVSWIPFFADRVISAVAIFALVALPYLFLQMLWAIPLALRTLIIAVLGVCASASFSANTKYTPYKHRFPNMAQYYDEPVQLAEGWTRKDPLETCRANLVPLDRETMHRWKLYAAQAQGLSEGELPKMVIVATSGGAYRASFWTTLALDRMIKMNGDAKLMGIADSVRFITGASGGMVGAGYFASLASEDGWGAGARTNILTGRLKQDISSGQDQTRYPVPNDTLSSISQQIIQEDMENILFAKQTTEDRGKRLEEHWASLQVPFSKLRDGEQQGWRPSIVLSPMLVETGQQMLISNLDLSDIHRISDADSPEFFDFFPCVYAGVERDGSAPQTGVKKATVKELKDKEPFEVATAVRMNATFPYISPTVALPTKKPMRVVDAGYYDNFGINVLTNLMSGHTQKCLEKSFCLRDWIRKNTSGVLLLEIRAFALNGPNEKHGLTGSGVCDPFADKESTGHWIKERDTYGGDFLTGPVEAVVVARSRAMVSRNEHSLVDFLGQSSTEKNESGFKLHRMVLANCPSAAGSLNWILPQDAFEEMKRAFDVQWNLHEQDLKNFWVSR